MRAETGESVGFAMSFCGNAAVIDGTTNYMGAAFTSTVELDVTILIPFNCAVRNLYCSASGVGAGTRTYTLRQNSTDTTLTASATGAVNTATDTVNLVNFSAGDTISMKVALTGGSTTGVQ